MKVPAKRVNTSTSTYTFTSVYITKPVLNTTQTHKMATIASNEPTTKKIMYFFKTSYGRSHRSGKGVVLNISYSQIFALDCVFFFNTY